ncbi:MAG: PP2C family protein-serine/threonine phosphatase, partial [Candidatus Sulfomarinibacteraceae bacterium]
MVSAQLESTIASLLDNLGKSFRLDRPFGGRSLGDHLDRIIREAATTEIVEFGTPGSAAELRRSADGVMNFFYRPHLFPGMDPALHLGHLVQYNLLPRELPPDSPIEAVAMLESYCHLSGDLFGWRSTPDGSLTMWVLDVSGHGVRAGFAAVVFKLILAETDPQLSLTALAKDVESRFIETRNPDDPGCIYATGVLLRISPTGAVDYLSAGHPPIVVRRSSGAIETFDSTAIPIALVPDVETESASFELEPGDGMVICTDGLLELKNDDGELFGLEHTIGSIAASDGSPCGIYDDLTTAIE